MLIWIADFRLGNKTLWVVVDVESALLDPRAQFLHPDRVRLEESYPLGGDKEIKNDNNKMFARSAAQKLHRARKEAVHKI